MSEYDSVAKDKSYCNYLIYLGASGDNYRELINMNTNTNTKSNIIGNENLCSDVIGVKMYLNHTQGDLTISGFGQLSNYFKQVPNNVLICVHCETDKLSQVLFLNSIYKKKIHICHVSKKDDILLIKEAKANGMNITCEVCPHHLFLSWEKLETITDKGSKDERWRVCPSLGTEEDRLALWNNMDLIDCFATDHAPHTEQEKTNPTTLTNKKIKCRPPPGFASLEVVLPLLLNAVNQGLLTIEQLIEKFHTNPCRILGIEIGDDTYSEVDMDQEWTIGENIWSKAKWHPYIGWKIKGKVIRTIINGETVYIDGEIVSRPSIKNIRQLNSSTVIRGNNTNRQGQSKPLNRSRAKNKKNNSSN